MAILFSTQFPIEPRASLDDLLETGKKWVYDSPNNPFEKEEIEFLGLHGDISKKGLYSLELGRVENDDSSLLGLKYVTPDRKDTIWTTYVIGVNERNKNWVSITVDYNSSKAGSRIPNVKKPYLIKLLLEDIGGGMDGDFFIGDKPFFPKEGDELFVADMLLGGVDSVMPIVYMSRDNNNLLSMNPEVLARRLSGISNVLVEPSREFSFNLRDSTKGYNIFGGAVGIYWPEGFGRLFWLPEQISSSDNPFRMVYKELMEGLKSRRLKFTWENLQSIHNRGAIEKLRNKRLKESKESKELEELYQEELERKDKDLESCEKRISLLENELRKESANKFYTGGLVDDPQIVQMYDGEVRKVVIESLQKTLNSSGEKTRRNYILEEVVKGNSVEDVSKFRVERLRVLFKKYKGLTGPIRRELQQMGFSITEDGKHYKLFLTGQEGGICVSMPKTPGDKRTGKNVCSDIIRTFF